MIRHMRYISLFSGIEAASVAAGGLPLSPDAFAETDPFCSRLLHGRFPDVPNLGDVSTVDWSAWRGRVGLVIGGPPCQSFSVAGERRGMADPRGALSLVFSEAVNVIEPTWSLTENVPGWLRSPDNAFGHFLGRLVGGDDVLVPPGAKGRWPRVGVVVGRRRTAAWRILDAQYFGVPQRRRRVFVLSTRHSGDFRCACALFPDAKGGGGNTAEAVPAGKNHPRKSTPVVGSGGERLVTGTLSARVKGGGGLGTDFDLSGGIVCMAHGQANAEILTGISPTLSLLHEVPVLGTPMPRRLTPAECEKLQGFPPGWTAIVQDGKCAADTPRYRAIGNSMAVPVIRWLFKRIMAVTPLTDFWRP